MRITQFLLARIAEDQALARDAEASAHRRYHGAELADLANDLGMQADDGWLTVGYSRVLAECEAKRRIVDLHSGTAPWCGWTHDAGSTHGDDMGDDCDTMRALASMDADHPDFDPAWKPGS